MVTQADVLRWAGSLDVVLERIASRFNRAEPRRRAAAYLRGRLAATVVLHATYNAVVLGWQVLG